jgi:hypothetical protein
MCSFMWNFHTVTRSLIQQMIADHSFISLEVEALAQTGQ